MRASDTPEARDRIARALRAYLRQEFDAPATAVVGFLEILQEEARRGDLAACLADLERMAGAAADLRALIRCVLDGQWTGWHDGEFVDAAQRLRHDLRTPLSAIKGYAELMIEDCQADGRDFLLHDLRKVVESVERLLAQVEGIATVIHPGQGKMSPSPAQVLTSPEPVLAALRAIRPLAADGSPTDEAATPSRILVIDDNASSRDLLSRRLIHAGHRVTPAVDGAEGLALASSEEFDLILLDLIMPGMSGFEVLCRLKADSNTRDLPVIVISALDEIDSVVRCIEAGAEDFLPKDFNPVLLRARIGASLEKKRMRDRERSMAEALRIEKERSEALLLNVLPLNVVSRLHEGERLIADRFHAVTILFCDLVDFTPLAARLAPSETVELLGSIFSALDELAVELGLERIKTIGDAYMVAGGLPKARDDHAEAVAEMAIRMLGVIRETGARAGHDLDARVGIHTGPVVAGVIGARRFAYDVWGDTVNTASRMESFGVPGRIHVSAMTRHALGDAFLFEPRGPIAVKGKGMMETFFLLGRRL